LKQTAIEQENFEFCIVLRDKQKEYASKIISKNELATLRQKIVEGGYEVEFVNFLSKLPPADSAYFYQQLRDQITSAVPFDPSSSLATQQASFEQAIAKLTPEKLQVGSNTGNKSHSGRIHEGNYFYALTHAKILIKELCFVLWLQAQKTLAAEYDKYTPKQLQVILSKAEKKFLAFNAKVAEFLEMHESVQKKLVDKGKFIDFINFNLSAYWVYAYLTFLLWRKRQEGEQFSFRALVTHRRLFSVILTNLTLVAKEVDYLNEFDFVAKLAKGSLVLGRKYDLIDGFVMNKEVQKKVISTLIS